MCGFGHWISLWLDENPIWYFSRFHLFPLLWFKFIIKSSCLFRWVVPISGLYSEHMSLVSCCWWRLFTRWSVLWMLAEWGWMNVYFLSLYLLIFFPCIFVPNHTPISLMQFVSFNFTEIDFWLNHRMTLYLLC